METTKTNLNGMTLEQIRIALGFKTVGMMKPIFGKMNGPIMGDRVLSRPLDHFVSKGIQAHALIVINSQAGTFTAVNVYEKSLGVSSWWTVGDKYDPKWSTNPITDKAMEKWDEKGYVETSADEFWPVVSKV